MFIDLSLPLEKYGTDVSERELNLFKLGHYGTHLDRLLGTQIPLSYFKSRGIVFDIRALADKNFIDVSNIDISLVQPDDFVLFYTGFTAQYGYSTKEYFDHCIEFSWELIKKITAHNVYFIGMDMCGLRRKDDHKKADTLCEEANIFVIENLINLDKLPQTAPFTVYTTSFGTGGTGLPCKVIAEIGD